MPSLARNCSSAREEYQFSVYPESPVITNARREVATLSRNFRKPRRWSRLVLMLQLGLVLLQLCLALIESVDAITTFLGDLW